MANASFEQISPVAGRIAVSVSKDELNQKLTAELKKQRGKTNMKGFRKGKTPLSALRKMMGNQLLGPILDETIRDTLFGLIDEKKLQPIFPPRPVEDEKAPMITATTLQDLTLTYDVALEPEFELELPTKTYDKYVLKTDDEFLDEQVQNMLKQAGENAEVEDGEVEAEDVLDVTFTEVGPMEDKITNSTKLYVDSLSEIGKELLLGKKVGDVVTIDDLNTLEKDSGDTYVKKYLLELEDTDTDIEGKAFELKIDTISRITPAEMDEEFFTKFDASGEITTEEQLRERIASDNASGFEKQGVAMTNFAIQRDLVDGHTIELPLEIMEAIHKEDPNGSFEMFQRGVKWMLVRNKFAEQEEVKLEYDDVKAEATESLIGMLGGQ
ncbi:MAG: trigger factor, partial [Bacteroidota bacterium]